jgi:hypothetical protein
VSTVKGVASKLRIPSKKHKEGDGVLDRAGGGGAEGAAAVAEVIECRGKGGKRKARAAAWFGRMFSCCTAPTVKF